MTLKPPLRRSLAALTLIVASGAGAYVGSQALLAQEAPQSPPVVDPEAIRHATSLSDAFKGVAKAVAPSVVNIRATQRIDAAQLQGNQQRGNPFDDELFRRFFGDQLPPGFEILPGPQTPMPRERVGEGSGVILSADGYIVTNNHVVANATELAVTLWDESEYKATVVGTDPDTDLAVIRIDASGLKAANFGDSEALEVGDWVLAIGSPFGLRQTVTAGIVSAKGRANMGLTTFEDFIQTDAAINPGNSGGPLASLDGQIVGINTAISTRTGVYNGVGFAIPSNMVNSVFNSIVEHGSVKRGALGVGIGPLTSDEAEYYGFKGDDGVIVTQVYPASPAEKAGLKVGDIITEIEGKPTVDNRVLLNTIAQYRPGDSIDVTYFRKGRTDTAEVTLADRSVQFAGQLSQGQGQRGRGGAPDRETSPATQELGLRVETLTPEIAGQVNATGRKGVVISEVLPSTPAAGKGLSRGDVITSVDEQPITTVEEFNQAIGKMDAERGVLLQVFRGETPRLVVLKPEANSNDD